ncbi:UTP--glucose-1-phosphate uridylyltransferase, partial [Sneathia sp. DSM 16630]|nr:UTP--glucose-1-phosphate uridylyltransferase [Sneathia sp. DSM 16630]
LESILKEQGKTELLNVVEEISKLANIYYVRQKAPLGLGHAISKAESFVGDEPFVVLLGDDIMYTENVPVTKQLVNKYYEVGGGNILGIQKVAHDQTSKYGIIDIKEQIDDRTYLVKEFVEKPSVDKAPSDYAALGRYVLKPEIFKYLKTIKPGADGEIQLTDAILAMTKDNNPLYAYDFDALRYDTGDKFGMFKANVEFGLRHPELKDRIREYLKGLVGKL